MSCHIFNKILLLLIFPSVTRTKPQRQNCFLGQCNQNNIGGGRGFGGGLGLFGNRGNFQRFPSFNPSLNIQNCAGSQCNQNNVRAGAGGAANGGSFFGGRGGGSGFPSFNPSLNIQNCRGSQCGQNNFRRKREAAEDKSSQLSKRIRLSPDGLPEIRKKREAVSSMINSPAASSEEASLNSVVPVTTVKNYVCAGGLVSSTCLNSHCRIICSDGVKYDADCGNLGTSLSSSPGSPGKTVVTVTCGGEPLTFPPCFPFCSTPAAGGGGGGGPIQPSLSSQISSYNSGSGGCSTLSLTSCISACPLTDQYQACVSACLAACSLQQYNVPVSPFPPCFPFCGPF